MKKLLNRTSSSRDDGGGVRERVLQSCVVEEVEGEDVNHLYHLNRPDAVPARALYI